MSNNPTKNNDDKSNSDEEDNNETLFLDFEEYKQKYLENRKNTIDSFINDNKINDKEKIVKFLESEFIFLEEQQKAIFYSNQEMMKYCGEDDEDINECRSENMKIIFKNLTRMKKIQSDIIGLDRNHFLKDKDLFESFKNLIYEEKDYKDPNKNHLIVEFIDRSAENNSSCKASEFEKNFNNFFTENISKNKDNEIISEIDL
jgi:hypothetical protein